MGDRRMGPVTATFLIMATMIGTGVFTTTGFLLDGVQSKIAVLAAWVLGGSAALFGALAYAELVSALPRNGGEYAMLSRIYGRPVGFVSAFASLVVGFAAPLASSSMAFEEYFFLAAGGRFLPPGVLAVTLIISLSLLHALRTSAADRFQNIFTLGKVLLMLGFIIGGLFVGDFSLLSEPGQSPALPAMTSPAFAAGLVFVAYAYSGWNAAAYVAGEVRQPHRNLTLSLAVGTLSVMVIYALINLTFLVSTDGATLAASEERVAHTAAVGLFGPGAGAFVSGMIALGLISAVGALVATGPMIYEAAGQDYKRLSFLSGRTEHGGPKNAILLQAMIALVMVFTSAFDELVIYAGLTLSLFAALTVAGVFVLRRREPDLHRPYRTWGHPLTSILFVLFTAWMIVHSVSETPMAVGASAATLVVGYLLYLIFRDRPSDS